MGTIKTFPTTPDPVVVIGPVAAGDQLGLFATPVDDNIYDDYYIVNRYEEHPNIWMHSVTSPDGFQGNTVAFTQTGTKTLLWIIEWSAARFNEKPSVPNPVPQTSDDLWIFLWKSAETDNVIVPTDGSSPLYEIRGTYVYGCLNPADVTEEQMTFPRPPWLLDTIDRTVSPDMFQRSLADNRDNQL